MHLTDQRLPSLPFADEPTPELRQAVAELVMAKTWVDRLARSGQNGRELATKCRLPFGENGTSFFTEVFPFCGHWDPLRAPDLRNVPLDLTIGNSWHWCPEHVLQEKRASLRERLLSCTDGMERAEVCWIVPLGLFLAHEGKNRIAFLRAEGASHYPALTTPYDYPAPDRLALIQVSGTHGEEWWAVLDQDLIEPMRCPEWALATLTAYGIKTTKGWPDDYPPYDVVRKEVVKRSCRTFPQKKAPVSLKVLQVKELEAAEEVSVSLMDLPGVRLRTGWKKVMTALVTTVVVSVPTVQPQLHELSILSAGLGAALMLTFLLFSKILAVPRASKAKRSQV